MIDCPQCGILNEDGYRVCDCGAKAGFRAPTVAQDELASDHRLKSWIVGLCGCLLLLTLLSRCETAEDEARRLGFGKEFERLKRQDQALRLEQERRDATQLCDRADLWRLQTHMACD